MATFKCGGVLQSTAFFNWWKDASVMVHVKRKKDEKKNVEGRKEGGEMDDLFAGKIITLLSEARKERMKRRHE